MLKDLNVDQARFIAILAKTARAQRDALLHGVREQDLGEPVPARGERNPAARLGLEPQPGDDSQMAALREAIADLSEAGRREVYALMRIGQGHLGAKKWHRGLSDAETLGDDTVTAAIIEDSDLHDHIVKGLYETELMA